MTHFVTPIHNHKYGNTFVNKDISHSFMALNTMSLFFENIKLQIQNGVKNKKKKTLISSPKTYQFPHFVTLTMTLNTKICV